MPLEPNRVIQAHLPFRRLHPNCQVPYIRSPWAADRDISGGALSAERHALKISMESTLGSTLPGAAAMANVIRRYYCSMFSPLQFTTHFSPSSRLSPAAL